MYLMSCIQLLRNFQHKLPKARALAFYLAQDVVARHVEDLAVEMELDAEKEFDLKLPSDLIARIQEIPVQGSSSDDVESYLLAWLLTFHFLVKSSNAGRTAYIDHLRSEDLVGLSLLPALFALLGVSDRTKAFDLSVWSVDDPDMSRKALFLFLFKSLTEFRSFSARARKRCCFTRLARLLSSTASCTVTHSRLVGKHNQPTTLHVCHELYIKILFLPPHQRRAFKCQRSMHGQVRTTSRREHDDQDFEHGSGDQGCLCGG